MAGGCGMWKAWLAVACCSCSVVAGPLEDLHAKDRGVQRAAVEALVGSGDMWVADLVAVAKESDRFDVRAHALEALARSGPEGLDTLVRLVTEDLEFFKHVGKHDLIPRVLASIGPGALDRLERGVLDENKSGYLLRLVALRMDADLAALARRLLASESGHARREFALNFMGDLPPGERERAFLTLLTDSERNNSLHAVLNSYDYGLWDKRVFGEVAAEDPIIADFVALLASTEPIEVAGAARALELSGLRDLGVSEALFTSAGHDRLDRFERPAVLRAAVAVHPDPTKAVRLAFEMLPDHPEAVCVAIDAAPVVAIPDDVIAGVVGLLVRTNSEYDNTARDVLAPRDSVRRAALAPRVVGPLAAVVRDGDELESGLAASTLERLGDAARDAAPALIERLGRVTDDEQVGRIASALISVGVDEPGAAEALTKLVQRPSVPSKISRAAGMSLRRLRDECAERFWVRMLIETVLGDHRNHLHSFIFYERPPYQDLPVGGRVDQLITELSITPARDALRNYTVAKDEEPKDADAATQEFYRRLRAANGLFWLDEPDARVVAALASVMASPVLKEARPRTVDREVQPRSDAMRRADAAALVWDLEKRVVEAAALTLAKMIDGDEALTMLAFFVLDGHPFGAASLVSAEVWDPRTLRTRPLEIPGHLTGMLLPALLEQAANGDPFVADQQRGAIAALGRMEIESAERDAVLLDVVRFGAGTVGPPEAVAAIARSTPAMGERIDFIREHLADPRYGVRVAAIRAAGALGADGVPLLDDLFRLSSERSRWDSAQTAIIQAAESIAPDDSRLAAMVRDRETARHHWW